MDAIIALVIIVAGFIVILSAFVGRAPTQQTQFFSQDLLDLYTRTPYNKIADVSKIQGIIDYADYDYARLGAMTAIEIMGELYEAGELTLAGNISKSLAKVGLPKNYGIQIEINDTIIYSQPPPVNPELTLVKATTATNTELHVFGVKGDRIWGPYKVEVKVWH